MIFIIIHLEKKYYIKLYSFLKIDLLKDLDHSLEENNKNNMSRNSS